MKRITIIFATLVILFPSSEVFAVDKSKSKLPSLGSISKDSKEPVIINGDTVEYSETGKTASATNNVVITYQDMKLTCKQAVFHIDTKEVYAEGDVLLTQGKNYFKGDRAVYNMETKTGTILNPKVFVEPWFYGGGEKSEKTSVNEYSIKRGYVTTCDKPQPHYRVQSKQLKVYMGDKVTASDILLFVDKLPIFYFPYYSHSLKDKHPGVTIIPGKDENWGLFLLTSWRYYLNEDFKGRILIDYREKRDFAYGVNLNYRLPNMGEGALRTYLAAERKNEGWSWRDKTETEEEKKNRWRLAVRHKWEMDQRTLGILEFNKMSDADVIKDYFMRDFQRDMVTSTYASVIRTEEYYTTSVLARKRVNKFDSVVEYLPQLNFETRNLQIGGTNFYYEGNGSFASLAKKFPVPSDSNYFAKRVDTRNQLQYQTNILGWLGLTPFVGTQQTWYNEDLSENSNIIRGNFFTGIGMNTRFSRIFDIKSNVFNMEINKLRHIISPTVSYGYAHRPTVSSSKLKQFDDVDSLGFSNAISPSIENKLQTKRLVGDKLQTVDLARFIVGTTYNFGFENKVRGGRLSNYDLTFEATPYNWMRMLARSIYDPHKARFESFSFDIVGNPYGAMSTTDLRQTVYADIEKQKWGYGGSYRWDNDLGSQLEGELMFNVTPKWKFTTYQRFDLKTFSGGKKIINDFGEQEYRLSRDLHCWIGDLVYNIKRGSEHTIWVVFRLKAFPDMPFEFQKRYYPPNFGTLLPGGK